MFVDRLGAHCASMSMLVSRKPSLAVTGILGNVCCARESGCC
jgi:hypothetical protein